MVRANGGGDIVLDVRDLRTYFATRWGLVKAVDGVSFQLRAGDTLGIVGESGCGKSVTASSIMRLVPSPPGHIVGGQVLLQGEDILQVDEDEMQGIRGSKIAIILQDPMTALNPEFDIQYQVGETLRIHKGMAGRGLRDQLVAVGFLENIGHRQLSTWWRIMGTWDYITGKTTWGRMERKGFAKS